MDKDDEVDAEESVTCGECSEDDITQIDEARTPRVPHDPGKPSRRDIELHLPLHWPFRSWCRHCVLGRATASPHRKRSE